MKTFSRLLFILRKSDTEVQQIQKRGCYQYFSGNVTDLSLKSHVNVSLMSRKCKLKDLLFKYVKAGQLFCTCYQYAEDSYEKLDEEKQMP